jgi:hypothetical protein
MAWHGVPASVRTSGRRPGRLNELPMDCSVASRVEPRMGGPLSLRSTSPRGLRVVTGAGRQPGCRGGVRSAPSHDAAAIDVSNHIKPDQGRGYLRAFGAGRPVLGEFRICRHFHPRDQDELSQSFDFRSSNAATKLKPGHSKANVLIRRAEPLLSRLPDAHDCGASCRYWRLKESATRLLPSI